jgi:hypothetical protein
MSYHPHAWSTTNELAFIARLGRISPHGPAVGRRELLRRYFQSLLLRERWGDLDPDRVVAAAQTALLEAALTEELIHVWQLALALEAHLGEPDPTPTEEPETC